MFGFLKKAPPAYVPVSGVVQRIGAMSGTEFMLRVAVLLEGGRQAYIVRISGEGDDLVALTKSGDEVEFLTKKGSLSAVAGTFVNRTLSTQGYQPHS